ncbi:hypothetical protein HU200_015918 [Digitaria exilis]|uniref:F-box domain-containing protein n=1 Tax=Digitaria exilis TaxID=1010633 RepID=A0A835KIX1_9POAL|nr:hypothetical protein HU200_015918 [Digitaria exilis]
MDVLFEVLLRFPADELCRLRLVCRSWWSLSTDPVFDGPRVSPRASPLWYPHHPPWSSRGLRRRPFRQRCQADTYQPCRRVQHTDRPRLCLGTDPPPKPKKIPGEPSHRPSCHLDPSTCTSSTATQALSSPISYLATSPPPESTRCSTLVLGYEASRMAAKEAAAPASCRHAASQHSSVAAAAAECGGRRQALRSSGASPSSC